MNPCGQVCDYARREYSTTARFFRSSNVETLIRWRRAADDAPPLGRPSAFMSIDWLDDGYDESPETEVGEVYGTPRPWTPSAPLVGLDYLHVCGTDQDFAEGAQYDPERDPVLYDDQGLPVCCEGPAVPVFPLVVDFEIEPNWDPGADCTTAQVIAVGETVTFPIGNGGQHWWWIQAAVNSVGSFVILPPTPNDPDLKFAGFNGICGVILLPTFAEQTGNTPSPVGVFFANGNVYIRVINDSGGPLTYSFVVTQP